MKGLPMEKGIRAVERYVTEDGMAHESYDEALVHVRSMERRERVGRYLLTHGELSARERSRLRNALMAFLEWEGSEREGDTDASTRAQEVEEGEGDTDPR